MMNKLLLYIFFLLISNVICETTFAQVKEPNDTFFLLKKKGLLKKLGESIYREALDEIAIANPLKIVNPFLAYQGKIIRNISVAPTGFYTIVHDTVDGRKGNFIEAVGDFFHKNTLPKIIRNNLFFKEGDKLFPLQLSDNERFLREQSFLQDARIVVQADSSTNFVDVYILTRDVFSIGFSLPISSPTKGEAILSDENLLGTGNKLEITALYDKERHPIYDFGATFVKRNIRNTFINWTAGFKNYNQTFNTGRESESIIYTAFDKPLLSRYNAWTGAAYVSYNRNKNSYKDTGFISQLNYQSLRTDIWAGINIGYKNKKEIDSDKRLRHFIALRSLYNTFYKVPTITKIEYDYRYANLNGFLASYSLYKQNFYRTNFIYGFGRNEDVPEGLNATLVAGYTNKQGVKRAYYGLEFDGTHFTKRGNFTTYTFRSGTFLNEKKMEDVDILVGINRFTKLNKLNAFWRNRNFFTINYTKQINKTILNSPLFVGSNYGLSYFNGVDYGGDTRTTVKVESVFYNLKKFLGFRFAPFVFSDFILLKEVGTEFSKSDGFSTFGGGIRSRNENLVFGTIELKGYYFPRVDNGIKNWRVEFATKLRFNFNTSFIRRPDFVSPN
jgi:hypothetical protein